MTKQTKQKTKADQWKGKTKIQLSNYVGHNKTLTMERQRTERKLKRERQGQTDLLILERRKIQQKSTPERRKKII